MSTIHRCKVRDMITQLHRVNLSIASPSEIEHTAQQLTAIREDFLGRGSVVSKTPRPFILDSWQRCRTLEVNPSRRCAPLAIARETQLYQLRENHALLMQAAQPIMNHLMDFLADSGYVIVLSAAQGRLLDVVGDATIRRHLARIDFVPGGNWSEAGASTNAIGTALADGHIVQLMPAEHYCDGWQDLTCTAAPTRHPFTGEVMGILDVTCDYRLIRSFLTNTLAEATLEASQQVHTLLTTNHGGEYAMNGRNTTFSFPGSTSLFEINLNNNTAGYITTESESESPYADEIQSQLAQQERRALDAERLAAASGAISSSLDLSVALDKVAEQLAHILRLECAAACIFDETDSGEGDIHIWSEQKPLRSETISTREALLGQVEAVSLIRERGEPVLIDDILTSPFLPATFVQTMGIRSMALFPLTPARGVIGFIAAPRYTPYHWVVDDVRLGLAFATQSATAIENARLFDSLQQHNRHV